MCKCEGLGGNKGLGDNITFNTCKVYMVMHAANYAIWAWGMNAS